MKTVLSRSFLRFAVGFVGIVIFGVLGAVYADSIGSQNNKAASPQINQ